MISHFVKEMIEKKHHLNDHAKAILISFFYGALH